VDQLLEHAEESLRNELPKIFQDLQIQLFQNYLQLCKAQSASSSPVNSQSAPGILNDPGKKDVVDDVEDQQANPNFLLFNESEPYYPNPVIYELCTGFDGDSFQIRPSNMILSDSAYFSNTTGDTPAKTSSSEDVFSMPDSASNNFSSEHHFPPSSDPQGPHTGATNLDDGNTSNFWAQFELLNPVLENDLQRSGT